MSTLHQPMIATEYREQWKKWILFRLGHPIVKVEISNAHLDMGIDEAVRRFTQWCPSGEKLAIIDAIADQTAYDLSEYIPEYMSVREVVYHPSMTDALLTSYLGGITTDFSFGSTQVTYFHGTYSTMLDYTLWNMYTEMYSRTIGREGMWRQIGNVIHLNPKPAGGVKFGVIYNSMLLDQDIRRDEWIKEWALTEVKMALGAARAKFQSLPGPTGDISMDGDRLIQEARDDQARLLERIDEYREPIMFNTG